MLRALGQASEGAITFTHRIFHTETRTALFNGNGKTRIYLQDAATEPYRSDLVSVTTLKVDEDVDGTFELTFVADTDYWLQPANPTITKIPARSIEIPQGRSTAPQLTVWPLLSRCIQIAGIWGYSELTEASGLTGTLSNSTDTTITSVEGGDTEQIIFPGDTLLIETEQVYVTDVDATTITVTRGVNGTTAAAHTTQALNIRRYPEDVEWAVVADAARKMWQQANGYQIDIGANAFTTRWPAIRDTLNAYAMPTLVL